MSSTVYSPVFAATHTHTHTHTTVNPHVPSLIQILPATTRHIVTKQQARVKDAKTLTSSLLQLVLQATRSKYQKTPPPRPKKETDPPHGATAPTGPWPLHCPGFTITLRNTAQDQNSLNE
jgi:hypothetical protein